MKTNNIKSDYYTTNIIEKRLALLVGAKYKDKKKIDDAILKMTEIKIKMTKKSKNFNGVNIIRKWRDERCKY